MAAISSIDASSPVGDFAAAITTLSASDTITFKAAKKQLLVLRNTTAGSLTVTIDGDGGTTVNVPGLGSVGVGLSRAVILGTISAYCKGTVTLSGASGLTAQLFDI
jgi:hypothetical protein